MNAEKLKAFIEEEIKIITAREVSSTNDEVKKIALAGEKSTVLYVADGQTAGRGRKGRSFFSPEGTGIYMSLLIHPDLSAGECTLITPLCAVAVAEAIEKVTGSKAQIKWVNDIFVGGRKAAGILTEGSFSEKGADYVIVGIGINLVPPEKGFPEEIREIAGAVTEKADGLREQLIGETVNRFLSRMKTVRSKDFLTDYKNRLFFLGREVTVINPSEEYKATALDIDQMCRLIVRKENGEKKALGSGEISVRV